MKEIRRIKERRQREGDATSPFAGRETFQAVGICLIITEVRAARAVVLELLFPPLWLRLWGLYAATLFGGFYIKSVYLEYLGEKNF